MTATFTGMGRGKAGPEGQFRDTPEEDTEEDLPLVLEDAVQQRKEGKQGASKSKSKKKVQATEGAEAPPEETPPDPKPTNPHMTQPLQNPSQAQARLPPKTARNPDEDEPPAPTKYVMGYKAAGKDWLDSVVKDWEQAYIRLFNELLK